MNTDDQPAGSDDATYAEASGHRGRTVWLSVLALLLIGLVLGGTLGYVMGRTGSSPSDDGPEAGFARDMQVHHAQAVEMSLIVREKSRDPALRAMAYDVITSQQQQIGQMYAWLEGWGLSQASSQAPMAWMSSAGHSGMAGMATESGSMMVLPDGRMPGMASASDLALLRAESGRTAEVRWLRLMIPHHQAGVRMAQAVIGMSDDPRVVQLARAIRDAQKAEIDQMRQMLVERGGAGKNP